MIKRMDYNGGLCHNSSHHSLLLSYSPDQLPLQTLFESPMEIRSTVKNRVLRNFSATPHLRETPGCLATIRCD